MNFSKHWLKPLARAGYASRGTVYLIIGAFAVLAAIGPSGTKGSEEALLTLLRQPFGRVLVLIMVAALAGFVLWRLVQSLLDTDDHGWSPRGLSVRVGLLSSAATYTLLAFYALSLLDLWRGGGSGPGKLSAADHIAAWFSLKPVLLAAALVIAGVAIAHFYKAATRRYADHFDTTEEIMRLVHPVSIIGLVARGAVWAVIALLLSLRFLKASPPHGEPPGIKAALNHIQGLPGGQWLLGATGVGLILFAAYSFSEAAWRRINVEDAG